MKNLILSLILLFSASIVHSQSNFEKILGKNIYFNDGSIIHTNICNLKFIGTLTESNKNIFLIIAGKACKSTESNISIYILEPSNNQILINENCNRYTFPGRTFYYEDNSLIMESRTFYGEVLPGKHGVIWFQKEFNDQNQWKESTFFVRIENGLLLEKSDIIPINVTLELLKQNKAFEIKGRDQISEP